MTTLHEAAQQALDALHSGESPPRMGHYKTVVRVRPARGQS